MMHPTHTVESSGAAPLRAGTRRWYRLGRRASISRRLFSAFGALVLLFFVASYAALAGLAEIERGLERMKHHEEAMRLALELASAVRDQYAHQAHTIILGNLTHLGLYAGAAEHVRVVTGEVRAHTSDPEARAWVDDIERQSRELDQIFAERIVPAVLAGESQTIQSEHGRAQVIVTRIQSRADQLAGHSERAIEDFRVRVSALQQSTRRWTLFFLVGAPLLAALIALYIARSIARPVALLEQGAARLASGDLSTRIDLDRPDELGALARQFNVMTTALREHQERLVQSEKLAGVGRLAAGVAHEINNPLGVILGYARVLRKSARGSLADELKIIEDEALRAQEIVEGLLDLARTPRAISATVDLRELCDEVAERWREQAGSVAMSVSGEAVVTGDPAKLRQVVLNLVKNAAEAAGPGGRVEVEVGETDGAIEVVVSDSGPGIAPEARERLFEPFYTTKPSGTGLGLAVSRAIARAHGGDIVAGTRAGGGARFALQLPRAGRAA